MVLNLQRAISRFILELTVYSLTETRTAGEVAESFTESTLFLAPFTLTPETLKYYPVGSYTYNDFRFYQIGAATLPERSIIAYNGNYYRVNEIKDRAYEGNYSHYMAKVMGADEVAALNL